LEVFIIINVTNI